MDKTLIPNTVKFNNVFFFCKPFGLTLYQLYHNNIVIIFHQTQNFAYISIWFFLGDFLFFWKAFYNTNETFLVLFQ